MRIRPVSILFILAAFLVAGGFFLLVFPPMDAITIADFSKTSPLVNTKQSEEHVVGLKVSVVTEGNTPTTLQLGCDGEIYVKLSIAELKKAAARLDWYSYCAEATFPPMEEASGKVILKYQFVTM